MPTLEERVNGIESQGLPGVEARVTALENAPPAGGIPVYTDPALLPTDGSILVAILEPVGGVARLDSDGYLAERVLVEFSGPAHMNNPSGTAAALGVDVHALGWTYGGGHKSIFFGKTNAGHWQASRPVGTVGTFSAI